MGNSLYQLTNPVKHLLCVGPCSAPVDTAVQTAKPHSSGARHTSKREWKTIPNGKKCYEVGEVRGYWGQGGERPLI